MITQDSQAMPEMHRTSELWIILSPYCDVTLHPNRILSNVHVDKTESLPDLNVQTLLHDVYCNMTIKNTIITPSFDHVAEELGEQSH